MTVRTDFCDGEVLYGDDLNDTFYYAKSDIKTIYTGSDFNTNISGDGAISATVSCCASYELATICSEDASKKSYTLIKSHIISKVVARPSHNYACNHIAVYYKFGSGSYNLLNDFTVKYALPVCTITLCDGLQFDFIHELTSSAKTCGVTYCIMSCSTARCSGGCYSASSIDNVQTYALLI
jgi:hypothetical protein